MKYKLLFLFLSLSVFSQETVKPEFFPFYENCPNKEDFSSCERIIIENLILGFLTQEIQNEILTNFENNKSVLTFAFVYEKDKSIREDFDIDCASLVLSKKIKQFFVELKPFIKTDSTEESITARYFEFVFLKNSSDNSLYIANKDQLKEIKHKSTYKYCSPPRPKICENDSDLELCINKFISNHIVDNFNYPKKAIKKRIQGKVECTFYIDKEGSVEIFKTEGPDEILEQEAQRILKKLPEFIPGTIKGVPSKFSFGIPIKFKLN